MLSKISHNYTLITQQAVQTLNPPPVPGPPVPGELRENAGAAENGSESDPTADAAKAVAVGTGAGLAVTGATAAGIKRKFQISKSNI